MRKLTAVAAFFLLTGLVQSLDQRIQQISSELDSTIGVAALHVESGRRVGLRTDERFPMGSVNKFPIAIAFLRDVDAGRRSLSQEITIQPSEFAPNHSPIRVRAKGKPVAITLRQLLEATVRDSDNTAADALLRLAGGASGVSKTLRDLGLSDIDVSRSKQELGADLDRAGAAEAVATDPRDTTTPAAMLTLLERFHTRRLGLSPESHDLLVSLMTTTTTGQRRIQAGAPTGAAVAHKTGTLPGMVNDVGIVTSPNGKDHVLIAVFTKGGKTSTMTQNERAVASIARAIYRDFIGWPDKGRASTR